MKIEVIDKSIAREAVESAWMIHEWFKQIYERFSDKIRLSSDKDLEYCIEATLRLLGFTSHVTKATAVAIASAYCVHAARLIELTGVSGVLSTIRRTMPGKGSIVHKVLAVAFPCAFRKCFSEDSNIDKSVGQSFIKSIVEDSIRKLERLDPIFQEEYKKFGQICGKDLELTCRSLIYNALTFLVKLRNAIRSRLGVEFDFKNCKVITEMQLISYALNVWGAPDVIIEDTSNRMAIVIEWKTVTGFSRTACTEIIEREKKLNVDRVQAYIYALLEAERLGYLYDNYKKDVSNLVEAIAQGKVIPFVVREHLGVYCNHWVCPSSGTISPWDPDRIRGELSKVILAAKYLTLLLASSYILKELDPMLADKVFKLCCIQFDGKPKIFKIFPPVLPHRFRTKCEKCRFKQICDLYIRRSEYSFESRMIEQIEYQVRDKILLERERDLLPYKVLYELSYRTNVPELVRLIENGSRITVVPVFRCDVSSGSYREFDVRIREQGDPPYIIEVNIPFVDRGSRRWRVDVFEEIEVLYRNLTLVLKRSVRSWEKGKMGMKKLRRYYYKIPDEISREIVRWLENIERDEPVLISTIRPQKPVSVIMIETEANSRSPTFMPNIFARVDDVYVEGNKVNVVVRPISNSMRFSVLSFINYVEANKDLLNVETHGDKIVLRERCLAMEANPDLTYIEIRTVSILRQALARILDESSRKSTRKNDIMILLQFIANGLLRLAGKK